MPYDAKQHEQDVLDFWKKDDTFKKSVEERPADKPYVFYDGPPFATGLPHYGHILASVEKDVVPRYQTMKGNRVERVWGWDCHGLPIENIVEKELGTKSKKDIEDMGVAKFNELCRSKVLSYTDEWKKTITRLGRWIDMDDPYMTMSREYMESVWWVFKQLWDKGYIYKGHRSMHICPRCETTLSQQEVSEGYKDIKDLSVVAKFLIQDVGNLDVSGPLYLLAWTTTPWTLPGNLLVAVGDDIEYSVVKLEDAHYVVAKELVMANFEGKEFEVVMNLLGKDLVGLTYEPLFPYYADTPDAFRVVAGDFVTTEEGTGMVHIAPGFGTDDYELCKAEGLPLIQHVGMNGVFTPEVTDFVGKHVKPADDHMSTDVEIIKWLAHNGKLFSKKKYEHSYPHCWRCDTPLLNYATDSWFVAVTKVKDRAIKLAEKINWSPAHIKEGRFGQWLGGARDWSISRQRFWATPLPLWESEDGDILCLGSVEELEALTGKKIDDIHKHKIDHLTFEKDGKTYTRVPDVLDTWFDSGSMPYAQVHYPFENKEKFEAGFPAQFIAEADEQTRAWFYYLHVLSTAIMDAPAYENVIVHGIVLAEDGKKMSKRLQNYPDPNLMLDTYGADTMRYYLMSSAVMNAENFAFSERGLKEVYSKVLNTLWNVVSFYEMFASDSNQQSVTSNQPTNALDTWILARLDQLITEVTAGMEAYKLHEASRPIMDFILDLSQWYVRLSRARFKGDDVEDKAHALATLQHVLTELSKVMAPFTPFVAERVWQTVASPDTSVHLEEWPTAEKKIETKVLEDMALVRKVVEMGHALRKEAKIPVRQPLSELQISECGVQNELFDLVAAELNLKQVSNLNSEFKNKDVVEKEDGELKVILVTTITDELKKEGLLREVVRTVNNMRKEQGLTREDRVVLVYKTDDALLASVFVDFRDELKASVLADDIVEGDGDDMEIDGRALQLAFK